MPQGGDTAAQQFGVVAQFLGGQRTVAVSQQAGDLTLRVEDTLALHFGRMGSQDRRNQGVFQETTHGSARYASVIQLAQRMRNTAGLRGRSGQQMGAAAAIVMLVFSDIGQVRKIRKRAHHRIGLVARQFLEQFVEIGAGLRIRFAAEAHRGLADGFYYFKYRIALLFAQHIAQQAAQQTNIFFKWSIFVGGGFFYLDSRIQLFCHNGRVQSAFLGWEQGLVTG